MKKSKKTKKCSIIKQLVVFALIVNMIATNGTFAFADSLPSAAETNQQTVEKENEIVNSDKTTDLKENANDKKQEEEQKQSDVKENTEKTNKSKEEVQSKAEDLSEIHSITETNEKETSYRIMINKKTVK